MTAVLATGFIVHDNSKNNKTTASDVAGGGRITANTQNSVKGNENTVPKIQKIVLSTTELAKHNLAQSCWLLISGKIYDVTNYIDLHPGGAREILSSCGTDATGAYNTKDGRGKPHSGSANAMLAEYYIGDLNQSLNVPASGGVTGGAASGGVSALPVPNPKTVPVGNWEDDD